MRAPLLTTILAAIAMSGCNKGEWTDTSMCIDVADDTETCPPADEVDTEEMTNFGWCSSDVKSLKGEGTVEPNPWFADTGGADPDVYCCYPAEARDADPGCIIGRPFYEDGEVVCASVRRGTGWTADVEGDPGTIDWLAMAKMEHASVAAFARLTLELLALGAPADIVGDVQRAAADEVEHARACFGMLAKRGEAVEPGPMPIGPVTPNADMASVAAATVREGCLGETLGAWLAGKAAEGVEDAGTRAVLERIAEDEARHAALSWKIVGWLLREGGEPVREAVVAAFREPFAVTVPAGMGSEAELAGWVASGQREVLSPAVAALLAA